MSSPIVSITPTFLLRGVDPGKISDQFVKGMFKDSSLPEEKVNLSLVLPVVQTPMSSQPEDDVYTFRTKGNYNQTVVGTGNQRYLLFTKEGVPVPMDGECDWCRQKFTHPAVGVPVQLDTYLNSDGQEIYVYYVDQCMCSCECVLAEIKRNAALTYRFRDPLYMDAEQMLRNLYSIMYPDEGFLREAPNYRLLRRNDGSLDHKDFHDKKHVYLPTSNLVLAPLKRQFLKISS